MVHKGSSTPTVTVTVADVVGRSRSGTAGSASSGDRLTVPIGAIGAGLGTRMRGVVEMGDDWLYLDLA